MLNRPVYTNKLQNAQAIVAIIQDIRIQQLRYRFCMYYTDGIMIFRAMIFRRPQFYLR
jgi:hypothetical protein